MNRALLRTIGQIRGSDLRAKSVRSLIALSIGTVAGRGTRLIRNMVLARILAPNEFALMAIINAAAITFEAITEVGVRQSVIQNKHGSDPDYLNVAWWVQIGRAICLFASAILLAPWISSFYHKPDLLILLRVSFLAILFRGLVSPRAYVLEKEYRFGKAVFLMQGSAVLGTIVAVALAFVIRNVWALVIGFVAEFAVMCLLSYVLVPFIPRFKMHREYLSELLRFARGVFGMPILAMVTSQADVLVLGKALHEEQFFLLGMYSLAANLAYMPIDLFVRVINRVLLPVFSEKQDDKDSLRLAILQTTRWTAICSIPTIALVMMCARQTLQLVYGAKFVAVAIPFGILCLYIVARIESAILGTMFMAVGQPHLHRRFVALRAAITAGLIYPAIVHFGLVGAAVIIVLSNFLPLPMQVIWCRKVTGLKAWNYVRSYAPGLLLALPAISIIGLLWLLGVDSTWQVLVAGTCTLLAAYLAYLASILILRRRRGFSTATVDSRQTLTGIFPPPVEDG
jgi:O-antigen/teichoic acid export membrane protein